MQLEILEFILLLLSLMLRHLRNKYDDGKHEDEKTASVVSRGLQSTSIAQKDCALPCGPLKN